MTETEIVLDDTSLDYISGGLQCDLCQHYLGTNAQGVPVCQAFKTQIPAQIWHGEHDHTLPFSGDHGITFSRKS